MAKKNISKKIVSNVKEKINERPVEFHFHAPDAKSVYLAGEFNNWNIQSDSMKKENEKDWKITINLSPGRYEYKYLVNGAWIEDVSDVEKTSNAYGTQNFVIHVK